MPYFTKTSLKVYAAGHPVSFTQRSNLKKALTDAYVRKPSVFLSHSNADKEDIESALVVIASQGVDVYVDWEDPAMPASTNSQTGALLKKRIEECDGFVLVATQNATHSTWVPWELGYADKAKTTGKVALVPIADPSGVWQGREYLGLYQTVQPGEGGRIQVVGPGGTTVQTLFAWFQGLKK